MNPPHPGFAGAPALVPGELRGFRHFRLGVDGLYPAVHSGLGAWAAPEQQAICGSGLEHAAPGRDCGCGIYGWYHPGNSAEVLGNVSAVIAVRGRTILGDRGFRAASARIEAVSLPPRLLVAPRAAGRTRRMLATRYPATAVYTSRRRMLRDHPGSDLTALGITAQPGRAQFYRRAAIGLWALGVAACYGVVFFFRNTAGDASPMVWLGALLGFVVWQTLLITLVLRISAQRRN